MAINIGNDAIKAVDELRGNPDFMKLLEALRLTVQRHVYASLGSPTELRVQKTAHADGMVDLVDALEMAAYNRLASQLVRPVPPKRKEPVE